ncbi:MAG: N-acetylneuraminate synthase family protein [Afipia sp.]|nr:N-acetylneuraminate synthase family protein [Afipia sp.]
MIDAIADCGCDCVKFQTFSAEEFCNNPDDVYEYVSQGKVVRESMLGMFKRLELKREEFAKLFAHARQRGLLAMSTPTDQAAVDLLTEIGVEAFKVGSDDLVYSPFLKYIAAKGKPIIISTGMAALEDVERAVSALEAAGNRELVILHCVSLYPTPEDEVNLRRIGTLQRKFSSAVIGFSDHSWGIRAALGAVALGAAVIEKHFTLDNEMPGPDHRFSANPQQLGDLVREVRLLEKQLGSTQFALSPAEKEMADLCHRSIYASRALSKGDVLSDRDFVYRRPGTGLMPYHADALVGRRLKTALDEGAALSFDLLEPK